MYRDHTCSVQAQGDFSVNVKNLNTRIAAIAKANPDMTLEEIATQSYKSVATTVKAIKRTWERGNDKFLQRQNDEYDLEPMTELFYGGAFGMQSLTHHGVFIGEGVVIEVGAESCPIHVLGKMAPQTFQSQCLGLTMLADFIKRAKEKGDGKVYKVMYGNDRKKSTISARFDRTLALLTKSKDGWLYNPFTHNCQHAASYISIGEACSRVFSGSQGKDVLYKDANLG